MNKFIIALLAATIAQQAHAATTGSAFLKITPGAREQGMANAVTALSGGAQSVYTNPASVAGDGMEAALSHVELAQENKLENIAFAHNALGGRMAYGFTYLHYGDLDGRDTTGAQTGTFTAYDMALQAAYARNFGKLSLGGVLKAVRNKIEEESGTGYGFDAGAIYDLELFRLGASIVNVGKSGKVGTIDENLPATASFGAATTIKTVTLAVDFKRNIPENCSTIAAGAEVALHSILALRAGYSKDITNTNIPSDNLLGFNAGFGIAISKLRVDYAYTSQGELGNSHRFTLTAKF
ncbi:MAG: PorV/PorQ family protein [Elusimicrobiales bacterium]